MLCHRCMAILVAVAMAVRADFSIDLDYSLNDESSYPLGKIELRRSFDGNYTGSFRASTDSNLAARLQQHATFDYTIHAKSSAKTTTVFTSFTKPCLILQSKLFHLFWITVDGDKLQSITVFPDPVAAGGQLDSTSCVVPSDKMQGTAKATVHVVTKALLPSPDTQYFLQKAEREKKARQHGADSDNRSFLAKYWMYIVPIVIFFVISSSMNPEAQQGGE